MIDRDSLDSGDTMARMEARQLVARARPFYATAVVLAVGLTLSGCGSSGADEAREVAAKSLTSGEPLTKEERLLARSLVSNRDIERETAGSVERAMLEYWSDLSYESWGTAVGFFDPRLRDVLSDVRLVEGLRREARDHKPVKPIVRGVRRFGNTAVVQYFIRTPDARLRPVSISWERQGGEWRIIYSATLDESIALAAQELKQANIDPTSREPAKAAIRSGILERRLQSTYLDQRRRAAGGRRTVR